MDKELYERIVYIVVEHRLRAKPECAPSLLTSKNILIREATLSLYYNNVQRTKESIMTDQTPSAQVEAAVVAAALSDSKPFWQSKTLWMSALTMLLPLVPGVGPVATAFIAANPVMFSAGVSVVFGALRLLTNNKVSVS